MVFFKKSQYPVNKNQKGSSLINSIMYYWKELMFNLMKINSKCLSLAFGKMIPMRVATTKPQELKICKFFNLLLS